MKKWGLHLLLPLFFLSCARKENDLVNMDDLPALKKEFIQQIRISNAEEGPFSFHYQFRTVFHSETVISLFGTLMVHDRLPHGWRRYEGKTFYTVNNQCKEVLLDDLFTTETQKEFLRKTCEDHLKKDPTSYFAGNEPLRTTLSQDDIHTFVVDDQYLIVIFQPYSVGGCADGPFLVKLPFSDLQSQWNRLHPIHSLLSRRSLVCITIWVEVFQW